MEKKFGDLLEACWPLVIEIRIFKSIFFFLIGCGISFSFAWNVLKNSFPSLCALFGYIIARK